MHPCSGTLCAALGAEGRGDAFAWCARAADFTAGKGGEFDLAVGLHTCGLLADAVLALAVRRGAGACLVPCCYGQLAALRCMRTVDTDRLWWARERGYSGSLGLLEPLWCSPKCSVVSITP